MTLQQHVDPRDDDYPYYEDTVTESTWHFRVITYLYDVLDNRYRDREDVHVTGNHFVYWEDGDRDKKRAPDVFVCFGAQDVDRKSYKIWESGPPPQVVFEITSEGTRQQDQEDKKAIYERIGVEEYYLFDPLGEYIARKLRGYRREGKLLLPVAGEALYSPRLDVDLVVEGTRLRLYDHPSGRHLGSYREEAQARREAEEARAQAEQAQAQLMDRALRLEEELEAERRARRELERRLLSDG